VFAGATHQQQLHHPQQSSRWSVSSDVTRHHHHHQLQASRHCCFSTSPSLHLLFSRSFIASSNAAVKIGASSQPITATSLFFQRRWKIKQRSFLHHPDGRSSIPSSQYFPAASSYNSHVGGGISLQQRGGGGATTTTAMSAVVTTEESSASSSSIESNNDNILKGGCNNDNNDDKDEDNTDEDELSKLILIHTYNCTTVSLMGLGMPRRQFATWVRYYLSNSSSSSSVNDTLSLTTKTAAVEIEEIVSNISTQQVNWENDWENHVLTLRQYWKDGKLLCEHTNLLNDRGGMSRSTNRKKQEKQQEQEGKERSDNMNGSDTEEEIDDEEERQMKYEHFRNILGSYADRLVNIVEDELSDASFIPHDAAEITNVCSSTTGVKMISELLLPRWNTRLGLRGWIENEYGVENTHALMANELLVKSEREQLEVGVFYSHHGLQFCFCHSVIVSF